MKQNNTKYALYDKMFDDFLTSASPLEHKNAIGDILAAVGLKSTFLRALKSNSNNIADTFISFKYAKNHPDVPASDRIGMYNMGIKSTELLKHKNYQQFFDLVLGLIFSHLCKYLELEKRKDFAILTDQDLIKKRIIPTEITTQYLLLEIMAKDKSFDWQRDESIIKQTMTCAGVCFADIYDFMNCDDI
jgi:hypothetical protein